ncbi:Glycosyl transferase family 8 [Mucilaginibacter lappiensis]|uniref:Lipopolysaccharide biosynthesis glycosyltransferase n=1 Tax=Mucilaginibacter lappiensis TaxID=354630 RepID=A0ABR6PTI7_9SPHI|nr:glycosyltransferase [Mucilaginibacter lappiensis]MBB6113097.1 lipopolysaccharide biosynthesis glycosyltransferase [Mucilaginibacter lappiensis]SIS12470.1 Glycosyl transferase family 8 [Mucilaginibacter lappiensis]
MKNQFVTYLGTDHFLPGVLVLNHSLRCCGGYRLLVLTTEHISDAVLQLFTRNAIEYRPIRSIVNPNDLREDPRNYKYTYTKLRVFELRGFEKVVYLDADMMVCTDPGELFDYPHFSAVVAGSLLPRNQSWKDLNSGLMVLEPSPALFDDMAALFEETPSGDGGDQGFLQNYFKAWPQHQELHLPHKYNVPAGFLNEYCQDHGFDFSYRRKKLRTNVSVLHFFGPLKPWDIKRNWFVRSTEDKLEQALLLWWDTYLLVLKSLKTTYNAF